jgi:hypothetical protein
VAVGDTKESSLLVIFLRMSSRCPYLDDQGELRTLSDHKDGAAFHELK